jgi:2-succinyl-6-hydroxy-2,4-cyclohexadiene-1-carboxylate synthase
MIENKRLNYRVFGNGHPVVFLHGFLESNSMWNTLDLEKFPFQSICIELPGHGDSPLVFDTKEPSIQDMTLAVIETLNSLGINVYDVVGHSMGGYVALELKRMNSGCEKVVLLNSTFWEDSEEKKKDRIRVADIALKAKDLFISEAIPALFYRYEKKESFIQSLIQEAKEIDGDAIAYAALAMRNRKNHKELLKLDPNDFLIIQGDHDPLIPSDRMKEELAEIPVYLEVVAEAGHMSHVENPDRIKTILIEFISKKKRKL